MNISASSIAALALLLGACDHASNLAPESAFDAPEIGDGPLTNSVMRDSR